MTILFCLGVVILCAQGSYACHLDICSPAGGSITKPGEGIFGYPYGQTIQIKAAADDGYMFVHWTGTAVNLGRVANPNASSTTLTLKNGDNLTLCAVFEEIPICQVSTYPLIKPPGTSAYLRGCVVSDGGGPCECRFRYWAEGGPVQYTPWKGPYRNHDIFGATVTGLVPGTTYYYAAELRNATCESLGATRSFVTPTPKQVTVCLTSSSGGSVLLPGEGCFAVDTGACITVLAFPDCCYAFSHWSGTAVDAGLIDDVTVPVVTLCADADYTLKAHFSGRSCCVLYVDDDAASDPGPGDATVGDLYENGTMNHPFDTIQEAIDEAQDGCWIIVRQGVYDEQICIYEKNLHITGLDPEDPCPAQYPIINAHQAGPAVVIEDVAGDGCVLEGLEITGGLDYYMGGLAGVSSNITVRHCVIAGNRCVGFGGAGVLCVDCDSVFDNCTISGNPAGTAGAGMAFLACRGTRISNSIVWANGAQQILSEDGDELTMTYCNVQNSWPGQGNIALDPLFALEGYWTDPAGLNAVWGTGDYHLQSLWGRYSPVPGDWVLDDVHSPCIDAGDPNSDDWTAEPQSNGLRLNMGAYGGTCRASLSATP